MISNNFRLIMEFEKSFSFLVTQHNFKLYKYIYDGYSFGNEYLDLVKKSLTIRFLIDRDKKLKIKFSNDNICFYSIEDILKYIEYNEKQKYSKKDFPTLIPKITNIFINRSEFKVFNNYITSSNSEWIINNFNK